MNTTASPSHFEIRRADDRGHGDHGWLDSHHTFSFSDYYDPRRMGYSALRVINEDRVVAGAGFPPHGHQNMEILSYVLAGALKHRDSSGGGGVLRPGELQLMSAGSGITHSEMNASVSEPVHFLQIWIEPAVRGVEPTYQQRPLDTAALRQGFQLIVAPAGEPAPFVIRQDARLAIAWPQAGQALTTALRSDRRYYLQVARGRVELDGETLSAGDAAMFIHRATLAVNAAEDSELLLFDLP